MSLEKSQAGSAGILAILALALLTVAGAGMFSRTATELSTAVNYREGVAAQYLAESGAREAVAKLTADPLFVTATANKTQKWTSAPINTGASIGTYTVTVTGLENQRAVSAVGSVGRAKRTIYFTATVKPGIYSSTVYCGADFVAEQNTQIIGLVGTNGNAYFGQNSQVSEMVLAHGTVITANSSVPKKEGVPTINIPQLSIPWGDFSYLSAPAWPLNGDHFVDGSLELAEDVTYSGDGTIYVNGSIKIGKNVNLNGDVKFVAKDNITIEQNMSISGNVILQAKGNISIGQDFGGKASVAATALIQAEGTIHIGQYFGKESSENNVAAFYANGAIEIEPGAKIRGFVISVNGVKIQENSILTYDDSLASSSELSVNSSTIVLCGPWSSFKAN